MTCSTVLRISDFCSTGSGSTPSRNQLNRYYEGGTIPWVKSGELRESLITATEEHVTETALKESSIKLVPPGAILLAMYGATVGRLGILGVEATTNQAVCHIVPDPKSADTRYLFHAISHQVPSLIAKGVGGAQPNINQGIIKDLVIRLPPLPEQRRIAAILDQADALRAKRREALAQLDSLTQSIFIEMFGDPETNPNRLPIRLLEDLSSRITKGESPKWQGYDYQDGGALFVTSENVRLGAIDLSSPKYVPLEFNAKLSRSQLEKDDLLINLVGASIGRSCIFPGWSKPANVNQAVGVVTANKSLINPIFLSSFLTSQYGQRILLGNRVDGARANISLTDLREITVPLPPQELQEMFVKKIAVVDKIKCDETVSLIELDNLFASLQHRAFRGEL